MASHRYAIQPATPSGEMFCVYYVDGEAIEACHLDAFGRDEAIRSIADAASFDGYEPTDHAEWGYPLAILENGIVWYDDQSDTVREALEAAS
jgi:hypothetical protein